MNCNGVGTLPVPMDGRHFLDEQCVLTPDMAYVKQRRYAITIDGHTTVIYVNMDTGEESSTPVAGEEVDCATIPLDTKDQDIKTAQVVAMCDAGVPFLRIIKFVNGEVDSTVDTALDGVTPFSASGAETAGECPAVCEPSVPGGIKSAWGV